MIDRKILSLVYGLILLVMVLWPTSILAIVAQTSSSAVASPKPVVTSFTKTQTRADAEIDRRVALLESRLIKLNSINRLTSAQQLNFQAQVQGLKLSLTQIKAQFDSSTDQSAILLPTQRLSDSYQPFKQLLGRMQILTASERLIMAADGLAQLATQLQVTLTQTALPGPELVRLKTRLTAIQAQLKTSQTQAESITMAVLAQPGSDISTSQTVLIGNAFYTAI